MSRHVQLTPHPRTRRYLIFTVNLHDRSSDMLVREIELLRATVRAMKDR
jgi:hypothetical protein